MLERGVVALIGMILLVSSGCVAPDGPDGLEGAQGAEGGTEPTATDVEPEGPADAAPVRLDVALQGVYPVLIGFDPPRLEAPGGANVTIVFSNTDLNPLGKHDWALDGIEGAQTAVIAVGETAEVTFVAPEPGTYAFYCAVPTHRDRGMEGTFTTT